MLEPDEITDCVMIAIETYACEPVLRSLLLTGIPREAYGHLNSYPSPADQVRNDLKVLNSFTLEDGRPASVVWLRNVTRLERLDRFPSARERLKRLIKGLAVNDR